MIINLRMRLEFAETKVGLTEREGENGIKDDLLDESDSQLNQDSEENHDTALKKA